MKKEGKTDETHEINIKKSTNQQFFHRRSKKIRKKNTRNKSQNSIRKTQNRRNRNTIYQFTQRNSNTRRIKRIIWNKMDNRKKLRQIKKQTSHWKIHRKKENNHRTRLLQPHIPIKYTNITQTWCRRRNNKKTKRNNKIQICLQKQCKHTYRKHKRRNAPAPNRR